MSTHVNGDISESVVVCEAWDDNRDPNPEVPVASLSPSDELAGDGEGGEEGGLDDSESEESEEASPKYSESNNLANANPSGKWAALVA